MEFYSLKNSKHLQIVQFCFKHDLYEADAIAQPLPTAKAVGYTATAPTGLTASLLPPLQGNAGSHGAALRTGLASSSATVTGERRETRSGAGSFARRYRKLRHDISIASTFAI